MIGIFVGFATLLILFKFWTHHEIDLKWKIIFTSLAISPRFIIPGIVAIIVSSVALIIMILMLRWCGDKIR